PSTNEMVAEAGQSGWLMYGPYARLDRGRYQATFIVTAESVVPGTEAGSIDVNGYLGDIPRPPLTSAVLKTAPKEQTISLIFDANNPQAQYQFRVFVTGKASRVSIRGVLVRKL